MVSLEKNDDSHRALQLHLGMVLRLENDDGARGSDAKYISSVLIGGLETENYFDIFQDELSEECGGGKDEKANN